MSRDPFAEAKPKLSQEEKSWLSHRLGNALHVAKANVAEVRKEACRQDWLEHEETLGDALRALGQIEALLVELTER